MKTYVKQIIVAILVSTAVVCCGYGVNKHVNAKPESAATVTDVEGSTYLVVYDEEENTYVAVTDDSGKVMVAATDAQGKVSDALVDENGNYYYVTGVDVSDLPTNTTAPQVSIDVNNDPNKYTTQPTSDNQQVTSAVPTAPSSSASNNTTNTTVPSTKPDDNTTTTTTQGSQNKQYLADRYKKLFEGGTYMMEFTTNDEELSNTPVKAAFKNGNILMSTTIMDMDCTMLFLQDKQEGFLVLNDYKKYCKLPEELMSEMSSTSGAISDGAYSSVNVTNVDIDGKTLVCEEYLSADKSAVKYYFDGESLVRRDRIDADGTETVMFFTKITSDVPDSTFEIPDNYGYINLSWAGFLFDN